MTTTNDYPFDFDNEPWQLALIEKYFAKPKLDQRMYLLIDDGVRPVFSLEEPQLETHPEYFITVRAIYTVGSRYKVGYYNSPGDKIYTWADVVDHDTLYRQIRALMNKTL